MRGRYIEQGEGLTAAGQRAETIVAELSARNFRIDELEAALAETRGATKNSARSSTENINA